MASTDYSSFSVIELWEEDVTSLVTAGVTTSLLIGWGYHITVRVYSRRLWVVVALLRRRRRGRVALGRGQMARDAAPLAARRVPVLGGQLAVRGAGARRLHRPFQRVRVLQACHAAVVCLLTRVMLTHF